MASIIKTDNIQKVSDDSNIIKKCGSTTTVGSGAGQTIVVCGATVTIGRCGGTVNLASGATQTGFGRSGSVNWCTTAKTSPFTATSGSGFFINTTGGAVTVTLPSSPSAGDIVAIKDYKDTFQTNNLTVARGGSKLAGFCLCATVDTQGAALTLVYVDGTQGWLNVNTDAKVQGSAFITATGGTIATCGDFKIHTFTADATFCVSAGVGDKAIVDYQVVAGGGGSNPGNWVAGGGAGGYREAKTGNNGAYCASPLATSTGIQISPGAFPITVGGGATGHPTACSDARGGVSTFSTITATGGGTSTDGGTGNTGGSGAGGHYGNSPGAAGNTPPVNPPQGNPGGSGSYGGGGNPAAPGGGGGASAAGANGGPNSGNGGAGATSSITGSSVTMAGGGGGAGGFGGASPGSGGPGGGGGGAGPGTGAGTAGGTNTGGGAGGSYGPTGANGGSGKVVIRYKFQ